MRLHNATHARVTLGCLSGLALLHAAQSTHAQQAEPPAVTSVDGNDDLSSPPDAGSIASVEIEMNNELGPQDLPGRPIGPRTRPPDVPQDTPKPPPTLEEREWFGGKSFWQWEHLTGDWGGLRSTLDDGGLTFNGSLTYDWSSVWSGGLSNRASTRSLLDINASFDTEKLCSLSGGTLFFDFQSTDVRGGSRDAGDIQGFSNIDTGTNVHQLSEAWYEQNLFDNALRIKIGKIDANSEFDVVSCGGSFLNSSVGFSPTVLTLPSYPDPAFGAVVFVYPTEDLYLGAGFFDGSLATGVHTGGLGPASLFEGNEYFIIGEAGLTWKQLGGMGTGRLGVGGWINTASFAQFDGNQQRNTAGQYLVIEQQLIARASEGDNASKGLFVFGRYGHADEDIASVTNHIAVGISLVGTFEGRDDDDAGFLVTFADLSDAAGADFPHDETAFEVFYKYSISPAISITADLQTIVHPSGADGVDPAVVGSLRIQLTF